MVPEKEEDKKKEPDFRSNLSDAYKDFDIELEKSQKKDKKKRQEVIENGLESLEKRSEKELVSSKLVVNRILNIRKKAGLSQTIGTAGKVKTPVLFGKDEFKQKLVQEILIIGTEELEPIGSAITIVNLIDYFRETRPNWEIKTGEIIEVIRKLEEKEVIPPRVDIGEDEVLVRFKPIEMSNDLQEVLRLATGLPSLSIEASHLGWSVERAQSTLTLMMKMDLAVLEEGSGEYYFPGIMSM
ncbi:MAG: hypothetical protein ACTSQF_10280 [Candidatus Heimdallarchaeaceae archaeon]